MADRYSKVFLATPPEYEALEHDARMLFAFLRTNPVEADGTVAVLRDREKIYQAITRAHGIPPRQRRRYDKPVTELFKWGFLALDGSRIVLPYWEAQQAWRKGPIPPMRREPNRATLTRIARETQTTLLEDFSRTSPTLLGDFSLTSRSLLDNFSPSNVTELHDPARAKRDPTSRLGLYRVGFPPGTKGGSHEDEEALEWDDPDAEAPF